MGEARKHVKKTLAGLLVTAIAATALVSGSAWADPVPPPAWCADQSNASILGTSADTGFGATGYPASAQTPQRTAFGWTTRFADNLKAQWGTITDNRAHNGALASDYLPGGRFPDTTSATADMATSQPDLVIIDLGGNEFLIQRDPAVFAANLATVIDNVHASRPGASILLGAYAELKRTGSTTYPWSAYVDKIRATAVAKGAGLMDLRRYVPASSASLQPSPSPWLADGQHMNDAGNLAEFAAYWAWVAARIGTC